MSWLTYVAARPDGEVLATARKDGWVCVWSPRDGRVIATQELGVFVNKLAWTVDGAYLLATAGDELVVLDADGKQRLTAIATGHDQLRTFAVHATKANVVVTTGGDGIVRFWDLPSGAKTNEVLQNRAKGSGGGTALAISDDVVLVGYENGYFGFSDAAGTGGGQLFSHYVASMAHVPTTKSFMCGGGKGRLAQLVIAGDRIEIVDTWSDPPKPIAANTIEFEPGTQRFIVACSDDTAALYASNRDKHATTFGTAFWSERKAWKQDYIVSAACFVPKTQLVATSHFTGVVKLWDTERVYSPPAIVTFADGAVKITRSDT